MSGSPPWLIHSVSKKNDEQNAGDPEDQSDEFHHHAASPLGIVEFIGAIASLLYRRAENLVEVRRGRIERDRGLFPWGNWP